MILHSGESSNFASRVRSHIQELEILAILVCDLAIPLDFVICETFERLVDLAGSNCFLPSFSLLQNYVHRLKFARTGVFDMGYILPWSEIYVHLAKGTPLGDLAARYYNSLGERRAAHFAPVSPDAEKEGILPNSAVPGNGAGGLVTSSGSPPTQTGVTGFSSHSASNTQGQISRNANQPTVNGRPMAVPYHRPSPLKAATERVSSPRFSLMKSCFPAEADPAFIANLNIVPRGLLVDMSAYYFQCLFRNHGGFAYDGGMRGYPAPPLPNLNTPIPHQDRQQPSVAAPNNGSGFPASPFAQAPNSAPPVNTGPHGTSTSAIPRAPAQPQQRNPNGKRSLSSSESSSNVSNPPPALKRLQIDSKCRKTEFGSSPVSPTSQASFTSSSPTTVTEGNSNSQRGKTQKITNTYPRVKSSGANSARSKQQNQLNGHLQSPTQHNPTNIPTPNSIRTKRRAVPYSKRKVELMNAMPMTPTTPTSVSDINAIQTTPGTPTLNRQHHSRQAANTSTRDESLAKLASLLGGAPLSTTLQESITISSNMEMNNTGNHQTSSPSNGIAIARAAGPV